MVDDEEGCSPEVAGIVSNSDNAGRRGSVYNLFLMKRVKNETAFQLNCNI